MSGAPAAHEARDGEGPLLFLIAGEPSGDRLGGRLMAALKALTGGRIRFAGVGGEDMIEEGLESLFPMGELSIMGFAEIVPRLPGLLRRIRQTADAIRARHPDAVVTIDSPGFSFRVAKRVAGTGIPLIHYVAPSVWAYAPGRARKVAQFLDHMLALLPFEPPYFEREGLPCSWVGHPVVEYGADRGDGPAFRKRHGIPPEIPVLVLLPGSRRSETSRLLPVFGDALTRLVSRIPDLRAVVPTVSTVAADVEAAAARWPVPAVMTTGSEEKYGAFSAGNAALAASGTVSVELAVAGVPHVVAYRVSPLTAFWVRRVIRVEYASLVNLVMGRAVVPELLQENCRGDMLAEEVGRLLADPASREAQRKGFTEALKRLGFGGEPPSRRAAQVVLDVMAGTTALPARKTRRNG